MSAARWIPDITTPEAFVAWMAEQPYKYEMIIGRLVMMAGGTSEHSAIAANTIIALGPRLRGTGCRVYTSDLMVHIGPSNNFYPDVTVACAERPTHVDRPVLVVEVLSDTTRREDLGPKLDAYRNKQGLLAVLYLHQDRPLAWLWLEGQERQVIEGLEAKVEIPGLHLALPMAELYEGLELPEPPAG